MVWWDVGDEECVSGAFLMLSRRLQSVYASAIPLVCA